MSNSLIRRRLLGQKVKYEGLTLDITNVSKSNISVHLIQETSPELYYRVGEGNIFRRWSYKKIYLKPNHTLRIFGNNPEGFSKTLTGNQFVISGDVSLGGSVAALSGVIRDYNFARLFMSCPITNLDENLFSGIDKLSRYCFMQMFRGCRKITELPTNLLPFTALSDNCYNSMFSLTGITKLQKGLLPAKNALTAYASMFQESPISEIESGAFGFSVVQSLNSTFRGCPITHLYEGSIPTCSTSGNGAFSHSFEGCSFSTIDSKWFDITPGVYWTYQSMFANNKLLETVEESLFRSLKLGGKTSGRQFQAAFANCTSLKKVDIPYVNSDFFGSNTSRPNTFLEAFKGCTSLENISVRFTKWSYIDFHDGQEKNFTLGWLTDVAPTGKFICPIELTNATDGYYDAEGNFVEGVGRGPNTIPEEWEIDSVIIDARDGGISAMALMAVIYGKEWSENSLYMTKAEAERISDIGGAFKGIGNATSGVSFNEFKYFTGLTEVPSSAFADSSRLVAIELPPQITKLGAKAFYYCSGLKEIVIPEGVESLGSGCFQLALKLSSISLPSTIHSIPGDTFYQCQRLATIDLTHITSLGSLAFGHNLFTSFHIPIHITSIAKGFLGPQSNLETLSVDTDHPTYTCIDNCIVKGSELIAAANSAVIPEGISDLGAYSLHSRKFETKKLVIPSSVKVIRSYAIMNTDLKVLEFPETSIVLENGAVWDNHALETIICHSVTPYSNMYANSAVTSVYVPDESVDAYKEVWSSYSDKIKPISTMPQEV